MAIKFLNSLNADSGVLYVDADNNRVGIGTTSPAAKLEVVASTSGSIKFTQGANAYQQQIETTGHTIFQRPDNHIFQVKRGTTTDMYIQSNGNVGIGLTNPSQKLHVDGNIKANGSVSVTNIVTNRIVKFNGSVLDDSLLYDNGTSIGLGTTSPNPWAQLETSGTVAVGGILYVKSSQKIQGLTGFPGSAGNLSINPDGGNVGIGTTSPSHTLDVNGELRVGTVVPQTSADFSVRRNGANIEFGHGNRTSGYYGTIGVQGNNGMPYIALSADCESSVNTFTTRGFKGNVITTDGAGSLMFSQLTTANATGQSLTERMRITSGGNVGIGTDSPSTKLDVKIITSNRTTLEPVLSVSANGSGPYTGFGPKISFSSNIYYGAATGNPAGIIETAYIGAVMGSDYANDSDLVFATRQNATTVDEKMRITSAGNVGIGTVSPVGRLEVVTTDANRYIRFKAPNGEERFQFYTGGTGNPATQHMYNADGTSKNVQIAAGGTSYFNGGNVGIGTTSPTAALHVQKAINGGFAGTIYNTQATGGFGLSVRGGNSSSEDTLRVQNVGGTYLLNVKGNGYVGIGTTSPTRKLHVNGEAQISKLGVKSFNASYDFYNDGTTYLNGRTYLDDQVDITSGYSLNFGSSRIHSTDTSYFNGGNVGIGTTAPANKLTVLGDAIYNSENLYPIAAASATDAAYKTVVGYDYSNDVGVISAVREGVQWKNLSILPVGNTNLGIGTILPTERLHVSGNLRVTGAYYDSNNSAGTSGQVLSSTATGTDWVSLSEIQGVDGSGTTNYIAKWSDTDTIANSVIYDNGTDVGIGTTSPNVELAVYQTSTPRLHLQNSTSGTSGSSGFQLALSGNDGYLWNWQNGSTIFATSNTERMRITSAGNVGIGTTSPNGKLHVYGGRLVLDNIATAQTAIQFNSSGSEKIVMYRPTSTEDFRIYTPAAGDAFTLLQSGNVGIGTTSPQQKLDVNGNIGLSGNGTGNRWILLNETNTYAGTLRIQAGGGSAGYGGAINMYGHSHATNPGDVAVGISNGSGGSFRVNSTGIDTGTDLFIVKSSGNVGIGTTSPSYKLDVQGNAGLATINTNGAIQAGGQFISGAGEFVSSSSGTDVNFRAGSTHLMVLKTSGNVGIGTTSPSEKLEVDGNVKANSFIGGNEAGIYTFNDTVNASASEDIFSVSCSNGAAAFRVTFVCNTSGMSVAKTYEVVKAYGADPVFFKVVDTGAYNFASADHDFDVSFTNSNSDTGVTCEITNNSTTINADIATTVFLGGSPTTITVTAL